MQARIAEVAEQDWRSTVCAQLDFSECMLYGNYLDQLGTDVQRSFTEGTSRCLTYWDTRPMISREDVDRFLTHLKGDELVLNIQSVSQTDSCVRQDAAARAAKCVEAAK
jgi:hypothetical protein